MKKSIIIWLLVGLLYLSEKIAVIFFSGQSCSFRWLTGFPCPGCGLTRSFISAFQLDFTRAFEMHPLFLLIPASIMYQAWYYYRHQKILTVYWVTFSFIFIITHIIRMITYFPHTEPMTFFSKNLIHYLLK